MSPRFAWTRAGLALGILLGGASPAAAQQHEASLWIDGAVGWGRLSLTCNNCAGVTRTPGTTLTVSLGGSPSPSVRVGVEGQVWFAPGGGARQQVRSLLLIWQWYPWRKAGLWVRAGTGLVDGPVSPDDTASTRTIATGKGVGFSIAAGHDLKLSRHLALRTFISTHIHALGDLVVAGGTADDTIAYVSQIGVGLTLR